ncbi:MAG: hypothetical protein ACO1OO_03370 [Flavisolibacter sp.]
MNAASIQQIKTALKDADKKQLTEICLRLARHKKENKELLSYLLFEADDNDAYVDRVKQEMDETFSQVNTAHVFFAKKTLRKALRMANRHIRFMASKEAEAQILLHYLTNFKGLPMAWQKQKLLRNIYEAQLKKAGAAIDSLHEDLQYDYRRSFERLRQLD